MTGAAIHRAGNAGGGTFLTAASSTAALAIERNHHTILSYTRACGPSICDERPIKLSCELKVPINSA